MLTRHDHDTQSHNCHHLRDYNSQKKRIPARLEMYVSEDEVVPSLIVTDVLVVRIYNVFVARFALLIAVLTKKRWQIENTCFKFMRSQRKLLK
jgi:hypothetical protein